MCRSICVAIACCVLSLSAVVAQEATDAGADPTASRQEADPEGQDTTRVIERGEAAVTDFAREVDESQTAREISAGILQPIYQFAELLAFSAFHWVAFAAMVAGVISFAMQLVVGKLVLLTKLHLSVTEILSDALGLAISLVGLVLTTQAAAENSQFTQSPAAVLSATAAGVLLGLLFYWWGQSQEIRAARAARKPG